MCKSELKVSVLLISYNHQSYIREALDSVLGQKTTFSFEVIIYDDKSTDGTRDVILSYQRNYPEIIKTIFPDENQVSQGKSPLCDYLIPAANGEYFAMLECDDYWIDDLKLQRQYEYMEAHKEVSLCAHSVELFNDQTKQIEGVSNSCSAPVEVSTSEIIKRGGAVLATCSYFCKASDMLEYLGWKPENCPVGDWPMMIYLSMRGKVCCLPNVMGRYRVAVSTSWTGRRSADMKSAALFDEQMIGMIYVLASNMPEQYKKPLMHKASIYLYDLAFRSNGKVDALAKKHDFPLESLSARDRFSLSARLYAKKTLDKARLLPLAERVMLRLASR